MNNKAVKDEFCCFKISFKVFNIYYTNYLYSIPDFVICTFSKS